MFASSPQGWPASNSEAALLRINSLADTAMCALAMGNATPWFAPIGLSNTMRSLA